MCVLKYFENFKEDSLLLSVMHTIKGLCNLNKSNINRICRMNSIQLSIQLFHKFCEKIIRLSLSNRHIKLSHFHVRYVNRYYSSNGLLLPKQSSKSHNDVKAIFR